MFKKLLLVVLLGVISCALMGASHGVVGYDDKDAGGVEGSKYGFSDSRDVLVKDGRYKDFDQLFLSSSSDSGSDTDSIGTEESKFGSSDPAVLVRIKIGEHDLVAPRQLLEQFDLLSILMEEKDLSSGLELPETDIFSSAQIPQMQNLLNLLSTADASSYSEDELLNIIRLADYFGLRDSQVALLPVLTRLQMIAAPDLAKKVDQNLPLLNFSLGSEIGVKSRIANFKQVQDICWIPGHPFYFVIFLDGTVQLYNDLGGKVGPVLTGVVSIDWNNQNRQFLICYFNDELLLMVQTYDLDGRSLLPQALILSDLDDIQIDNLSREYDSIYSKVTFGRIDYLRQNYDSASVTDVYDGPNDLYYLKKERGSFWGDCFYLYTKSGKRVGSCLKDVKKIKWDPNGRHYIVIFNDNMAQMYDLYSFNSLKLDQQLLVQYIIDQFDQNKKAINLSEEHLRLLDQTTIKILIENGFLKANSKWLYYTGAGVLSALLAYQWYQNQIEGGNI